MDTPKPEQRGNFVAFTNRDKQPGDKRPAFDGRISAPYSDDERRIALWAHEFTDPKTGEVRIMFSGVAGAISTTAAPLDQIAAMVTPPKGGVVEVSGLKVAPLQVLMFPNGFKDEDPKKDRPDYWGVYNTGDPEKPIARIGVWFEKDRNGYPVLSGRTTYPQPGKSEAQIQDALAQKPTKGRKSTGEAWPVGKSKAGDKASERESSR